MFKYFVENYLSNERVAKDEDHERTTKPEDLKVGDNLVAKGDLGLNTEVEYTIVNIKNNNVKLQYSSECECPDTASGVKYICSTDTVQVSLEDVFKYFDKVEPLDRETNMVAYDSVNDIIKNSMIVADTVFDKCTVVYCQLPNGFVIVESSACVDPGNYDENTGIDICMKKIEDKIWELEGYRLQCDMA